MNPQKRIDRGRRRVYVIEESRALIESVKLWKNIGIQIAKDECTGTMSTVRCFSPSRPDT